MSTLDASHLAEPSPPIALTSDGEWLDDLVRELAAVQKEQLLYPSGHPRLEERFERLERALEDPLSRGPIVLTADESFPAGPRRTLELSLRERGVRRLALTRPLSRAELEACVAFFLCDPSTEEPRRFIHGVPGTEVEFFQERMADSDSRLEEEPSGDAVAESDWLALSPHHRAIAARVIERPTVRLRIGELETLVDRASTAEAFEDGVPFLRHFFELLTEHSPAVWSEPEAIERLLLVAMDALAETIHSRVDSTGRSATEDGPESWVDRLYWRALRQLFPGDTYGGGRRDGEENTDCPTTDAQVGGWTVDRPCPTDWGETPIEVLRPSFSTDSLGGVESLVEYLNVCDALARHAGHERSARRFGEALTEHLRDRPASVARGDLLTLSSEPGWLGLGAGDWLEVDFLRSLSPETIIAILRRNADWSTVLEKPPGYDPGSVCGVRLGELEDCLISPSRRLVRELLAKRDAAAFCLVLRLLREFRSYADNPWREVFDEIAQTAQWSRSVLAEAAQTILSTTGVGLLSVVPIERMTPIAKRYWRDAEEEDALRLAHALGRLEDPIAIRYLELGLDRPSPSVRLSIIGHLGDRSDRSVAIILERLFREQNEGACDLREIYLLCEVLLRRTDTESQELIQRLVSERKGWARHRWRREIRQAVRETQRQRAGKR